MKVTDIQIQELLESIELSAVVDGYRLWYRVPKDMPVTVRGDVFLVACLLPAMAKGEPLEICDRVAVCPRLLQNLDVIQDIFIAWAPAFRIPFRRISVRARAESREGGSAGVGSFFSGGVDGTYTFLRHRDELTHLVFVRGIDMQLTNERLYNDVWSRNTEFARQFEKPLIPVVSNVRFFGHAHNVRWHAYFGAGLSSIAHALGMGTSLVASGVYYSDLVPHGSHPLTDPLWSSATTSIVHDGADMRRIEKLRTIAKCEPALRILRVCWQDNGYNCGRCEKCLRTMVQLRLLGLNTPTLPELTDLTSVRRLDLWDETERGFLDESLAVAKEGNDRDLLNALLACSRRNDLRALRSQIDEVVFAGKVRGLYRWLKWR